MAGSTVKKAEKEPDASILVACTPNVLAFLGVNMNLVENREEKMPV